MNLQEYLLNCALEEEGSIKELLRVDNAVQRENITYADIMSMLKIGIIDSKEVDKEYIAITDGEFDSVYRLLCMYGNDIETIYIDHSNIAINKWLVERTKRFYKKDIILNLDKDYASLIKEDKPVIISGDKEFKEAAKEHFKNSKMIVL